jgi:hypothetical protein
MTAVRSFSDPSTHFVIEVSETPFTVDGYNRGEPMRLKCEDCGAAVDLDADPETPGIDDIPHRTGYPQRFVRSRWFREQLID